MTKRKNPKGAKEATTADASAPVGGASTPVMAPTLRRSYAAPGEPAELFVVDEQTLALRTPYDPEFVYDLKMAIPRKHLEFLDVPKELGLPFKKGWFILNAKYWDAAEAAVERHYGVGSRLGACRWLGVFPSAAPAVIATAYFCRRTDPGRDERQDTMLEQAIKTLEQEGYRLAPPYGPGGVSESKLSLLDLPPTPFELPPRMRIEAETAVKAAKNALAFKLAFDRAWQDLVAASASVGSQEADDGGEGR